MAVADHLITTIEQLEALYGKPYGPSVAKEIDHISPSYRKLIEAAPFVAIATGGPEGLDCSPKGDAAGFVRILDDKTLAIPDRPGNNRLDGFRNILLDPRIAVSFLIPGIGETLRVNGRASISIDPDLMQSFAEIIHPFLLLRRKLLRLWRSHDFGLYFKRQSLHHFHQRGVLLVWDGENYLAHGARYWVSVVNAEASAFVRPGCKTP